MSKNELVAKIEALNEWEALMEEARAEAETIRIKAEAEAEANKKLMESLNEDIIKLKFYEKWDGKLPEAMGSDSVITNIGG